MFQVFLVSFVCVAGGYYSNDGNTLRGSDFNKVVNVTVSTGAIDAIMMFDTTHALQQQLHSHCAAVVSSEDVSQCAQQVLHELLMHDKQCIKRYHSKILGYNLDILLRDPYDLSSWQREAAYLHSFGFLQHVSYIDFWNLVQEFSTKALSKPIPYSEVLLPNQHAYPLLSSLDYVFIDRYLLSNFLVTHPTTFDTALPWPHVAIDNVMKEAPLRLVAQEMLEMAAQRPKQARDAQWRNFHDHNQHKQGTSYLHLMGHHVRIDCLDAY